MMDGRDGCQVHRSAEGRQKCARGGLGSSVVARDCRARHLGRFLLGAHYQKHGACDSATVQRSNGRCEIRHLADRGAGLGKGTTTPAGRRGLPRCVPVRVGPCPAGSSSFILPAVQCRVALLSSCRFIRSSPRRGEARLRAAGFSTVVPVSGQSVDEIPRCPAGPSQGPWLA